MKYMRVKTRRAPGLSGTGCRRGTTYFVSSRRRQNFSSQQCSSIAWDKTPNNRQESLSSGVQNSRMGKVINHRFDEIRSQHGIIQTPHTHCCYVVSPCPLRDGSSQHVNNRCTVKPPPAPINNTKETFYEEKKPDR